MKLNWISQAICALLGLLVMSFVLGPELTLVVIGFLYVHEVGHGLALKWYRIPIDRVTFTPISIRIMYKHELVPGMKADVIISLAGSVTGLVCLITLLYLGMVANEVVVQMLYWTVFLDLLPTPWTDGGVFLRLLDHWKSYRLDRSRPLL